MDCDVNAGAVAPERRSSSVVPVATSLSTAPGSAIGESTSTTTTTTVSGDNKVLKTTDNQQQHQQQQQQQIPILPAPPGYSNNNNNNNNAHSSTAAPASISARTNDHKLAPPPASLASPTLNGATSTKPRKNKKRTLDRSKLRKGKWTIEEEEYTSRIIHYFSTGTLTLPEGTTLRSYLAEKLSCDPMRITKKYAGASCLGKRVYHLHERSNMTTMDVEAAKVELTQLEHRFRMRVEHGQAVSSLPPLPSRSNFESFARAHGISHVAQHVPAHTGHAGHAHGHAGHTGVSSGCGDPHTMNAAQHAVAAAIMGIAPPTSSGAANIAKSRASWGLGLGDGAAAAALGQIHGAPPPAAATAALSPMSLLMQLQQQQQQQGSCQSVLEQT